MCLFVIVCSQPWSHCRTCHVPAHAVLSTEKAIELSTSKLTTKAKGTLGVGGTWTSKNVNRAVAAAEKASELDMGIRPKSNESDPLEIIARVVKRASDFGMDVVEPQPDPMILRPKESRPDEDQRAKKPRYDRPRQDIKLVSTACVSAPLNHAKCMPCV